MAAPRYVPSPAQQKKYYESTRKVKHSSGVERPAEVFKHEHEQSGTGHPGPDQGYALRLVKDFKGKIFLFEGEHWEDASEVAVLTALKRASLFGRAPCNHDLEAGFCIWGYLDSSPQEELLMIRKEKFGHIGSAHNYLMRRYISDAVSAAGLKRPLASIQDDYESNWRTLVDPSKLDES
tara:strand:+ start:2003 stop:2539 length:537 start_codon:yes stop_codon:yes gene_type:complete